MRTSEYWKGRFERLEKAQNANGVRYVKNVQKEYDKALKSIERDLSYWYTRFAKANGVSYAEAKRLLSTKELQAFRMDVKEYIAKGESLDPRWREQLEQASVKVHVSRLESLKLQIQQEVEKVSGDFNASFENFARNTYSDQYYKTAYEIQKGLRVGWEVMRLDKRTIDKVVRKPWASDGRNFSERVWANRSKLVNELHTNLTQGIIRGDDPQKTINALADRMNVSRTAAGRLIMTESAFFSSAATKYVLKDLEVEKYEILATLDSRTSQTCRDMDGKVFKRSEYEIGVTAPPFHVWCRTTTVPYFDDDEAGKRAARNEEGEYYLVPEDMTYREWEKTFVEGGSKEGLEVATPEALAAAVTGIDAFRNTLKDWGFKDVESVDFSDMDEEVFEENAVRLNDLLSKFPIVAESVNGQMGFSIESDPSALAWVSRTQSGQNRRLTFSKNFFQKGQNYFDGSKHNTSWSMPCAEDNYKVYTLTHEFGHMLHNTIVYKKTNGQATSVKTEVRKLLTPIKNLAKKKGGSFDRLISGYGKTNSNEAFAEIFANAFCGKPNALGEAMLEWLKEEGYLND